MPAKGMNILRAQYIQYKANKRDLLLNSLSPKRPILAYPKDMLQIVQRWACMKIL